MFGASRPVQNVVATFGIGLNPPVRPTNIRTWTDVDKREEETTPAPQMLSTPPAKPITIVKARNNAV